jgi:hypothetical protein
VCDDDVRYQFIFCSYYELIIVKVSHNTEESSSDENLQPILKRRRMNEIDVEWSISLKYLLIKYQVKDLPSLFLERLS